MRNLILMLAILLSGIASAQSTTLSPTIIGGTSFAVSVSGDDTTLTLYTTHDFDVSDSAFLAPLYSMVASLSPGDAVEVGDYTPSGTGSGTIIFEETFEIPGAYDEETPEDFILFYRDGANIIGLSSDQVSVALNEELFVLEIVGFFNSAGEPIPSPIPAGAEIGFLFL